MWPLKKLKKLPSFLNSFCHQHSTNDDDSTRGANIANITTSTHLKRRKKQGMKNSTNACAGVATNHGNEEEGDDRFYHSGFAAARQKKKRYHNRTCTACRLILLVVTVLLAIIIVFPVIVPKMLEKNKINEEASIKQKKIESKARGTLGMDKNHMEGEDDGGLLLIPRDSCRALFTSPIMIDRFTAYCEEYISSPAGKAMNSSVHTDDARNKKECQEIEIGKNNETSGSSADVDVQCRTLWINGFTIGYPSDHRKVNSSKENQKRTQVDNANSGDGYQIQYAAALHSHLQNAKNVLQPVLILLSPPPDAADPLPAAGFQKWAESMGVIVIRVHRLSFQKLVYKHYSDYEKDGRIGYYMRFDIPQIIRKHKLFQKQNICDRYVLYTDSDILFLRQVERHHIEHLKKSLADENKILMYGQDFLINRPKPSNTGVMLMDVPGFEHEFPKILKLGKKLPTIMFPEHDQLWLNRYYADSIKRTRDNALLPPQWNWKVYWKLGVVLDFSRDIFIVHFHGPKVGEGVDEIASCDVEKARLLPEAYQPLVQHAICCDEGRTAAAVVHMYNEWKLQALEHSHKW